MDFTLLSILQSYLLIKPKNQLSLLISVPDYKCRIRFNNLGFKRISRDFQISLRPPLFFYRLEIFSRGSLKGLFFYLCFGYNCNVFFALWSFSNEVSFVSTQVFALQSVLKLFFLLVILIAIFPNVVELFVVFYLYFLRESGMPFA